MILKYKYHDDSGLLEAYRSYTLAQNNSLSDTIVITSTARDAEKYNYCLEFICYNSKSIPKAQYISPILNYEGGCITFAIPNNLTEFRGHVDMQLTGYDPNDNSIVFKSVSKNCKAFDVEGSLCVLEKDLNDTPNVFTEVLKQLEDLQNIRQDIIDEALNFFSDRLLKIMAQYKWCKVKFYDNGRLLEERLVSAGSKLTPPQYTLPAYCVIVGGWYCPADEKIWDMDSDTVQEDTQLYLNYKTDDVEILNGVVVSLGKRTRADIYIPEFCDGYKVTEVKSNIDYVPYESRIHLGNNMENFEILLTNSNVWGLYFPQNNEMVDSIGGSLYVKSEGECILCFVPKFRSDDSVTVVDGCISINTMAINNNSALRNLYLPSSMQYLLEYCICNTGIEELTLPPHISGIGDYAVCNNPNLKRVILQGDSSSLISDDSFVNVDSKGNVTRPKLAVQPQHYANYVAKGLAYQIEVLGQDYFDGIYARKGE